MNDRINAALDGELSRDALSAGEQARLEAVEAALEEAAGVLRTVSAPDLTARVMSSLPREAAAESSGSLAALAVLAGWFWRPKPITVGWRPAYAFAASLAAIVLVVGIARGPATGSSGDPTVAAEGMTEGATALFVQFRLEAPGASRVEVAGSFTGWQPRVELLETAPGVWTGFIALEPGVHDYTFVVDGSEWVPDPFAPHVDDGFGGSNSRLFLTRPGGNV